MRLYKYFFLPLAPPLKLRRHAVRGPGGYFGILRIIFAMAAGLLICFITLRISSNCFIRRLTSVRLVPEPFAIRLRRLWLMVSGLPFSYGVIDWMMASIALNALSSTSTYFIIFPTPGI